MCLPSPFIIFYLTHGLYSQYRKTTGDHEFSLKKIFRSFGKSVRLTIRLCWAKMIPPIWSQGGCVCSPLPTTEEGTFQRKRILKFLNNVKILVAFRKDLCGQQNRINPVFRPWEGMGVVRMLFPWEGRGLRRGANQGNTNPLRQCKLCEEHEKKIATGDFHIGVLHISILQKLSSKHLILIKRNNNIFGEERKHTKIIFYCENHKNVGFFVTGNYILFATPVLNKY